MAVNGEAIHGASAWKASAGEAGMYYTAKGSTIYAIATERPQDGFTLTAFNTQDHPDVRIKDVRLLGSEEAVMWKHDQAGLRLTAPQRIANPHALVYRIETQ